jgi:hypothetical protein
MHARGKKLPKYIYAIDFGVQYQPAWGSLGFPDSTTDTTLPTLYPSVPYYHNISAVAKKASRPETMDG